MSDTPRTDAVLPSQSFIDQTRLFDRCYYLPLIEHARKLERELAARPEEKALCPHGYFYRTCGLCNTEPSPEPGPSTEIAPPPGHECSAAETIQYAITLLEVSGGNPKVIEYLRAGLDQHEARSSPRGTMVDCPQCTRPADKMLADACGEDPCPLRGKL